MAGLTDPVDYVEALLALADDDQAGMLEVQRDLERAERRAALETMAALRDEDDPDERARLYDVHVLYIEQSLRAHEAFIAHSKRSSRSPARPRRHANAPTGGALARTV